MVINRWMESVAIYQEEALVRLTDGTGLHMLTDCIFPANDI